jgi:hypothetical protein
VPADPPYLVRYHEHAGTWASTSNPVITAPARTRLQSCRAEAA